MCYSGCEAATASQRAAVETYVAAIGELAALTDEVLTVCATLSQQTIEKLLAKSDLKVGLEALEQIARGQQPLTTLRASGCIGCTARRPGNSQREPRLVAVFMLVRWSIQASRMSATGSGRPALPCGRVRHAADPTDHVTFVVVDNFQRVDQHRLDVESADPHIGERGGQPAREFRHEVEEVAIPLRQRGRATACCGAGRRDRQPGIGQSVRVSRHLDVSPETLDVAQTATDLVQVDGHQCASVRTIWATRLVS
ncbi:hypothetical protein ACQP1G_16830 [Nocardia sp. CA-107356]|uniref:hypothetical protein n=1 Tax=Nocardia sp. CA-107356 TaxID=3239972 RepID=UPI003D8BD672